MLITITIMIKIKIIIRKIIRYDNNSKNNNYKKIVYKLGVDAVDLWRM